MEKLKENKKKYYIFVLFLFFFLLAPFAVLTGHMPFVDFLFYLFLLTPPVLFFSDRFNGFQKKEVKSDLLFSEKGIRFYDSNDEGHDVSWSDLVIQKRVGPNRFFTEFIFKNIDGSIKSYSQLIYWPNEVSYVELVKKYSPKDHDLYKLVEEHSKRRGIEF